MLTYFLANDCACHTERVKQPDMYELHQQSKGQINAVKGEYAEKGMMCKCECVRICVCIRGREGGRGG